MITNIGKNIIAKYLAGQTPSYASHIAIGCGARPLDSGDNFSDYSTYNALDFEMFRVPVTSRGYINEGGVAKVVFTAELPSDERYDITEIGVYSGEANPSAGLYDSRIVFSFSQGEGWQFRTPQEASALPVIYTPLDENAEEVQIQDLINYNNPSFQTNADNKIFTSIDRINRYERPRFLNNTIFIRGDQSELILDPTNICGLSVGNPNNHIEVNGVSIDFNKNAPTDLLKLAFSVVNKDGQSAARPDQVRVLMVFTSSDRTSSATFGCNIVHSPTPSSENENNFLQNRHIVITKELQELGKTPDFSWTAVETVKIYASVIKDNQPSPDFFVALDAIRLDNVTTINPLYGLTGYSVIKNSGAAPIIKNTNTSNFVEFRFGVGFIDPSFDSES